MRENKAPGTKVSHMFCEGFGPLQLGLVLVLLFSELNAGPTYFFFFILNLFSKNTLNKKSTLYHRLGLFSIIVTFILPFYFFPHY